MVTLKKIFKICIAVLVLLGVIYEIGMRVWGSRCIASGMSFVAEQNTRIYLGDVTWGRGLYELDAEQASWKLRVSDNFSRMTMTKDKVLYTTRNDTNLWLCDSRDPSKKRMVASDVNQFAPCGLSRDNARIAYFEIYDKSNWNDRLVVKDLKNGNMKRYSDICSPHEESPGYPESRLTWSPNGNFLLLSGGGEIVKIQLSSGESELITKGTWGTILSENEIGFWRGSFSNYVCYKMNLSARSEMEVYRNDRIIIGAAWEPSGRSFITMVPSAVHGFLFIPKITYVPYIWDIQTKTEYRLPETTGFATGGFVTGYIFWENSK